MTTTNFVLRTADQAWIERHDGTIDPDTERVTVQVPTDQVERTTFCGHDWLRFDFTADTPADALNGHIMCPVAWVS